MKPINLPTLSAEKGIQTPVYWKWTNHRGDVFNLDLRPAKRLTGGWVIEGRNAQHYGGNYWMSVGYSNEHGGSFKSKRAAAAALKEWKAEKKEPWLRHAG
jgi:hypothetical protein